MPRTKIKSDVVREVLIEAGYRCAVPTCRNILAIDMHHIVEVKDGGPNEQSNLLALCPTCHALYTRGTISKEAINAWKTMLVALNHAFDKESISNLLFLYRLWQNDIKGLSELPNSEKKYTMTSLENGMLRYSLEEGGMVSALKILLISGDGVLKFSHLIASGLAEYYCALEHQTAFLYTVSLTKKGINIVEAWFSGNRDAVKNALGDLPQE